MSFYAKRVLNSYSLPFLPIPHPIFVSPSVVPTYNPSLRVYTLDNTITYTQYYVHLEYWNSLSKKEVEQRFAEGEFLYEVYYESGDDWREYADALAKNDTTLREEWGLRLVVGYRERGEKDGGYNEEIEEL
jgi:hypothetical protein